MEGLPDGWRRETLSELGVHAQPGFASGKHAGTGDVLHLRPMNISPNGVIVTDECKYVTNDAGSLRTISGDVLFNNTNSLKWVGKTAYVSLPEPVGFSNHMTRLRVSESIDARYLAVYLHFLQQTGYFESIASNHVNQASVPTQRLMQVQVALPSLDEQRRIVAILEDHLAHLHVAGALLQNAQRGARTWEAQMTDTLIWQSRAPLVSIGSILREPMRNGRSDRAVEGEMAGTRTLTITAVTRDDFSEINTKVTRTTPEIADGLWLDAGDILVQRANTPELVGTTARYDGTDHWAIFPDLLIRLRTDEKIADSRYVVAAMRSERTHKELRAKAKGLAGSMPKIDQAAIATLMIPLPTFQKQQELMTRLGEIGQASKKVLDACGKARLRGSALRHSLLAAAFRGDLTADWRADQRQCASSGTVGPSCNDGCIREGGSHAN